MDARQEVQCLALVPPPSPLLATASLTGMGSVITTMTPKVTTADKAREPVTR